MSTFLKKYAAQAYALMRIVAGLLFLCHGSQKLLGFPAPAHEAPAYITYGAGSIELIGGALIMVGLFAGWVAFICSGEMAVAYWMAHASKNAFPMLNGGELSALYCFLFLCIAAHGAGIWSVDAVLAKPIGARTAWGSTHP
jgi:putative oxidoreductase